MPLNSQQDIVRGSIIDLLFWENINNFLVSFLASEYGGEGNSSSIQSGLGKKANCCAFYFESAVTVLLDPRQKNLYISGIIFNIFLLCRRSRFGRFLLPSTTSCRQVSHRECHVKCASFSADLFIFIFKCLAFKPFYARILEKPKNTLSGNSGKIINLHIFLIKF